MLQKIKNKLFVLAISLGLLVPIAAPGAALAAVNINDNLCSGANVDLTGASTDCTTGADKNTFQKKLENVINIISIIVGVVAVIMIIIGGFRYITSGGSPDKVTGAKNTILYGIIGLIIVALAQVIVKFVLNQTASAQ